MSPSENLTTATHRALAIALAPPRGEEGGELHSAVHDLCAEARRDGTRAEELIVLFKKVWSDRPEIRAMSREDTGRLFDKVVTMCIREYYDGHR